MFCCGGVAVIKDVTKQTFSVTLSKAKGLCVKILRFAQNDKYLFRYNSIADLIRNPPTGGEIPGQARDDGVTCKVIRQRRVRNSAPYD